MENINQEKLLFSFDPADILLKCANGKILTFFIKENKHVTIHFRERDELLDIHTKTNDGKDANNIFVVKYEDLLEGFMDLFPDLISLILPIIHQTTYESMVDDSMWLEYNEEMKSRTEFGVTIKNWADFENDYIGRSYQRPIEQMTDHLLENKEILYQVYNEGETEPIGFLIQRPVSKGKPALFLVYYQEMMDVFIENSKSILSKFYALHNQDEKEKLEAKYAPK